MVCLGLIAVYQLRQMGHILVDLCGLGIGGYFASLVSYFEFLMTCSIVGFLFYEVPLYIEELALNDDV